MRIVTKTELFCHQIDTFIRFLVVQSPRPPGNRLKGIKRRQLNLASLLSAGCESSYLVPLG
jgi:hypothetical protein